MQDIDSVTLHGISRFSHVEYELQRTIVSDRQSGEGRYLLIFVVHHVVEFGMTDLTEHFGVDLSGVTICCVFIVFLCVLFPFCLDLLGWWERCFTSTDNITRRDC